MNLSSIEYSVVCAIYLNNKIPVYNNSIRDCMVPITVQSHFFYEYSDTFLQLFVDFCNLERFNQYITDMKRHALILISVLIALITLNASSPAGVFGVELWISPKTVSNNLNGWYSWNDFSGDSLSFYQKKRYKLLYSKPIGDIRYVNFRPSMYIDTSDSSWVQFNRTELEQFSSFGVWFPDNDFKTTLFDVKNFTVDTVISIDKNKLSSGNNHKRCLISSVYYSGTPKYSAWGRLNRSNLRFGFGDSYFKGFCPELLVYGRILSQYERSRIESFLAMRYGITLQHSYYVGDTLLWDCNKNIYHNNIAAIGFDSSKCFRQLQSASLQNKLETTFIDADSYYDSNPYHLSSNKFLLTVGYEPDCLLPDGQYIIWGDNNGLLSTMAHFAFPSVKILNRIWKFRSTVVAGSNESENLSGDNMSIFNMSPSKYAFIQDDISKSSKFCIDNIGREGFFSFKQRYNSSDFEVYFVNSANTQDKYGFRFCADNSIVKIENTQYMPLDTMRFKHFGHNLAVKRTADCIRLYIDHIGDSCLTISSDFSNDTSSLVVAFSPVGSSSLNTELYDVRIGDKAYTGQQIELSYENLSSDIHPDTNTAMFLNSDNDRFNENPDTLDYDIYYSTRVDTLRKKVIFDDVRLNSQNLTEYITFAQIDSLYATAEKVCGPNGVDSVVDVNIKYGIPPYKVILKRNNGSDEKRITYNNYIRFSDVYPETDSMFVCETGWRILAIGKNGIKRFMRTKNVNNHNGSIYCSIPNLISQRSSCIIGYALDSDVTYGIMVNNGELKLIIDGEIFPATNLIDLSEPTIEISYDEYKIKWIVGDSEIRSVNVNKKLYGMFEVKDGVTDLDGVIFDGYNDEFEFSPGVFAYPSHNRWYKAPLKIFTLSHESAPELTLKDRRNKSSNTENDDIMDLNGNYTLSIVRDKDSLYNFTAVFNDISSSSASFVVFDAVGRMVFHTDLSSGTMSLPIRFSVPSLGAYVAKMITDTNEYSQKFLAN